MKKSHLVAELNAIPNAPWWSAAMAHTITWCMTTPQPSTQVSSSHHGGDATCAWFRHNSSRGWVAHATTTILKMPIFNFMLSYKIIPYLFITINLMNYTPLIWIYPYVCKQLHYLHLLPSPSASPLLLLLLSPCCHGCCRTVSAACHFSLIYTDDPPTRDRIRDCVRATRYCGRTIKHATSK